MEQNTKYNKFQRKFGKPGLAGKISLSIFLAGASLFAIAKSYDLIKTKQAERLYKLGQEEQSQTESIQEQVIQNYVNALKNSTTNSNPTYTNANEFQEQEEQAQKGLYLYDKTWNSESDPSERNIKKTRRNLEEKFAFNTHQPFNKNYL